MTAENWGKTVEQKFPQIAGKRPDLERIGVIGILSVYCFVQLNNIRRDVFVGQDFGLHEVETYHIMANPHEWFTTNFTNRPLLYWIGELCASFGPEEFTYQRTALVFIVLSVTALVFLYMSVRQVLGSTELRLAALTFISLLPVTVIAAIVYAADTVTLLPFAIAGWALGNALQESPRPRRLRFSIVAGLALTIGQLAKFTFIFAPLGACFAVLIFGYVCRWTRRDFTMALLLTSILPLCFGLAVHFKAKAMVARLPVVIEFEAKGTGEMSLRSLLGIKVSDQRILNAPIYWDLEKFEGKYRKKLLVPNNFSYMALLHLGVFTDVLNLAVGGWNEARNGRGRVQQACSVLAVRAGLLVSLLTAGAMVLFVLEIARATLGRGGLPAAPVLSWGCLAASWFLPLAGVLPFVHDAYGQGYWLPRLLVPSLWGFAVVLFFYLEKLTEKGRIAKWSAIVFFGFQYMLYLGSLWN